MLISQLTPPVLKKIIRKTLFPVKIFNDFNDAQHALAHFKGYENADLIDFVFLRTKNFIEEIKKNPEQPLESHHLFLVSLIGLIAKNSRLKVLDFGGAFGTHYFIVKAFFPELVLDWTVVELPQVIEKGQALNEPGLKFFDIQGDFDNTIGDFDLVLTSGTLQHMPDPEKTLKFLCKHKPSYLALLRLGFNVSSRDLWVIHKALVKDCGPGPLPDIYPRDIAAFPFCMISEKKLNESLCDYQLKLSNVDLSGTLAVPGFEIKGFNQLYQLQLL